MQREFLIDVSRLLWRLLKGRHPTGVGRVCREYLKHYGTHARSLVQIGGSGFILNQSMSRRLFETLIDAPSRPNAKIAAGLLARGLAVSGIPVVAPGTVLINPGHTGLESERYARFLRQRELTALFVVHDLIPLTHPEFCRPGTRKKHLARMKCVLETGHGVVTNSQATLDVLSAFAERCGARLPPSAAALLGPGMGGNEVGPRVIPEPYFVVLGTIEPRKNHWLLLQVWRCLVDRLGNRAPRLVLIGRRGWECENVVDLLERCEALRGVVVELPACSDFELTSYLHHSQALLFPSLVEGYGIPVLEALVHGVPVIASSLPVFREFAGDVPEYIHPLDGKRWEETIMDFATPLSALREAQLKRLADFRAPTWAEHFSKVDELLERMK